ncbi:50S ribosomal protein L23 [Patescibacteria group bacterium]|nr:MAG: 50S ribosomal protein L23 [Patescibacteria group bacterium]
MALFGKKKREEKKKEEKAPERAESSVTPSRALDHILIRPRVTEKATDKTADNVYVFEVSPEATKRDICQAVEFVYKVKPRKVAVTYVPRKKIFSRRRRGMKAGGKKAYVYLKAGEKIEVI